MSNFDLTKEQELELIIRAQSGDRISLSTFVEKNQGLIHKIARGLSKYGIPHEDLIQEGNVGLMNAIYKFDPSKNTRFSTIAVDYIRTPIHKYIRQNYRIVKGPSTVNTNRLFHTLPKLITSPDQLTPSRIEEISEELQVSSGDVEHAASFLFGTDHHIVSNDEDPHGIVLENIVEDCVGDTELMDSEEEYVLIKCLHECIEKLPDHQKSIIKERWCSGDDVKTLKEMAAMYGVKHQAISQHEQKAIATLRETMQQELLKYGL